MMEMFNGMENTAHMLKRRKDIFHFTYPKDAFFLCSWND